MLSFEEKLCESLLKRVSESAFSLRTYSIRQHIDLYRGCQFDCAYCFSASYKRESLAEQDEFGSRIEVCVNGPAILARELAQQNSRPGPSSSYTCLGLASDTYQPADRKYQLTRECLKVFIQAGSPVTVLTKSHLCQRDIDLWSQLAERNLAVVGFTLTMPTAICPVVKHTLEPQTPSPLELLRTIELFVAAGIKTYVFVDPILPFVTDDRNLLSQLLHEIANTGNRKVHFGVLKLTPATWRRLSSRLATCDERLVPLIQDLYFNRGEIEFRDSRLPDASYRRQLYRDARAECQRLGLGFSCEGGEYDLWLDDWAAIQDPYRCPTGYNLWQIVRRRNGSVVAVSDAVAELKAQFGDLPPAFIDNLSALWESRQLFAGLRDIAFSERGSTTLYYYKT